MYKNLYGCKRKSSQIWDATCVGHEKRTIEALIRRNLVYRIEVGVEPLENIGLHPLDWEAE